MNLAKYYIIQINEDGDVSVTENSAEDMKKLINADEEDWDAEIINENCNAKIPEQSDPNYWGDQNVLIIKGKIVMPKAVTTVTKYEIE